MKCLCGLILYACAVAAVRFSDRLLEKRPMKSAGELIGTLKTLNKRMHIPGRRTHIPMIRGEHGPIATLMNIKESDEDAKASVQGIKGEYDGDLVLPRANTPPPPGYPVSLDIDKDPDDLVERGDGPLFKLFPKERMRKEVTDSSAIEAEKEKKAFEEVERKKKEDEKKLEETVRRKVEEAIQRKEAEKQAAIKQAAIKIELDKKAKENERRRVEAEVRAKVIEEMKKIEDDRQRKIAEIKRIDEEKRRAADAQIRKEIEERKRVEEDRKRKEEEKKAAVAAAAAAAEQSKAAAAASKQGNAEAGSNPLPKDKSFICYLPKIVVITRMIGTTVVNEVKIYGNSHNEKSVHKFISTHVVSANASELINEFTLPPQFVLGVSPELEKNSDVSVVKTASYTNNGELRVPGVVIKRPVAEGDHVFYQPPEERPQIVPNYNYGPHFTTRQPPTPTLVPTFNPFLPTTQPTTTQMVTTTPTTSTSTTTSTTTSTVKPWNINVVADFTAAKKSEVKKREHALKMLEWLNYVARHRSAINDMPAGDANTYTGYEMMPPNVSV